MAQVLGKRGRRKTAKFYRKVSHVVSDLLIAVLKGAFTKWGWKIFMGWRRRSKIPKSKKNKKKVFIFCFPTPLRTRTRNTYSIHSESLNQLYRYNFNLKIVIIIIGEIKISIGAKNGWGFSDEWATNDDSDNNEWSLYTMLRLMCPRGRIFM